MLQSNQAVEKRTSNPAQTIRNTVRSLASFTGAIFLLSSSPAAHATFATPGQFDVSPTGAATYTVPIAVPPGTAGMAPSLALSYNSQGGNGLLGMGWSLSGLSAVTRCPKTIVQDTANSVIKYNNTDRYCLDGQRLITISGTYGANGTEYRTERDGYSKIVSYGAIGTTGPAWFKVWTKSGQVLQFGATADSRIEAEGLTAVKVWAVNSIVDTKGNYLTVSYTEDNANGQYYPNRIDYTGNTAGGLTPYNSVRFVYATRPDIVTMYDSAGTTIKNTVRLTNVQTYAKVNNVDTLVKDYRLAYAVSPATKRSRITSFTECDGSATPVCLPATAITWDATGDAIGNATAKLVQSGAGWNGLPHRYAGDFNGDGKPDMVVQNGTTATAGHKCMGLAGGFSCAAVTLPSGISGHGVVADFDNDGDADYFGNGKLCKGPALTGCVATGLPQKPMSPSGPNNPASLDYMGYVGDVNGDGYSDLIFYEPVYVVTPYGRGLWYYDYYRGYCLGPTLTTCAKAWVAKSNDYPSSYASASLPLNVDDIAVGDFNGDGKSDLIYTEGRATYFCSGTAVSGATCTIMNVGDWGRAFDFHTVDFNGDGISDLFLAGDTVTYFCAGPVLSCSLVTNAAGWNTAYNIYPGDYNGDGMTDLYLVGTANSYFCAGPGIATANNCIAKVTGNWKAAYGTSPAGIYPGDYDGDGTTDLFLISDASRYFVETGAGKVDRTGTIINGLGAATTVTYKPLTDTTVYTKEASAVYPYLDIQAPLYVVSSVASSNGVGGNYTSDYSYIGGKSHVTGGGFLGFRQTVSTDAQTGIKSTTTYRQDYPYQGLPLTAEKRTSGNVLLNKVSNTWAFDTNAAWSAQYHIPELAQSIETSYELSGTLISTVTTCNTYDGYGNPTYIGVWTTTTAAGINCAAPPAKTGYYVKETVNEYTNDTVRWYLGRLTNATVTSTTP